MAVVLSVLKTEMLSSVRASLYSAALLAGNDNVLADLLNAASAGNVSVGMVFSIDLQQAVVAAEYAVLSSGQRDLWNAIVTTGVTGVAISNTALRAQVAQVWSAGTTTRSSLLALDTRTGSRAEMLFGAGIAATPHDTYTARTT